MSHFNITTYFSWQVTKKSNKLLWNVTSTNTDQVSILTYLWISPSIMPKLTLRVAWCFREERGEGRLCCSPDWGSVSCVGGELAPGGWGDGQFCVPVWGFVSWLDVGPVSFCARSFFRRQDNWGLRRRTRVPPIQRTLETQTLIKLIIVLTVFLDRCFSCLFENVHKMSINKLSELVLV